MREITTHKVHVHDRQPTLTALGNPTIAGAEQDYEICYSGADGLDVLVPIHFVSLESPGVTNEALLAIVKDRLEGFQAGKFPCQENEDALAGVNHALKFLHKRTLDRTARGVESKATA
jgi:hypothetical protein